MNLSRRCFIGTALGAVAGCRTAALFGGRPELKFGVVSDIHVTTRASTRLFEKSLRYFEVRGADAVMVPGDLTDWGNVTALRHVADAWNRVFPNGRASDGRAVARLFVSGNHDFEGWNYGDMAAERKINACNGDANIVQAPGGMAAVWKEVFGEDYSPIQRWTVKGCEFVCAHWGADRQVADWMAKNAAAFNHSKPFFYFQHLPATGTTPDGKGWADGGSAFKAFRNFPNAVVFTGHSHRPFSDERLIWQGEFTAIATPSLSYACFEKIYENGGGRRDGTETKVMPMLPARQELRGGQGYFVSVYADRVVVERVDLEEDGEQDVSAWIFPVCASERPYAPAPRAATQGVPEFPAGADVRVETRNTENRQGKWAIALHCDFPSAVPPKGLRVHDYEIRVVPKAGGKAKTFLFQSPAYHRLARYEPARQKFWFSPEGLPETGDYLIEVRARNSFGSSGKPITGVFHRGV